MKADVGKVSKTSVNYRRSEGDKRCGTCSMYSNRTCTLVRGSIRPGDVCDEWEKR